MASPQYEVFFLYDAATGAPATGVVGITFETYKDHTGVDLPQPTIFEIGGGAYQFTATFTPNFGIVYVIDAGTDDVTPRRVSRFMRPEDWNIDNADVPTSSVSSSGDDFLFVRKILEGSWRIHTVGADVNRMVFYDTDGITPIAKFDLFDKNGVPTSVNPYRRVKVP